MDLVRVRHSKENYRSIAVLVHLCILAYIQRVQSRGLIKKRKLQDRQIHLNLNYGTNKPLLVNETMDQKQTPPSCPKGLSPCRSREPIDSPCLNSMEFHYDGASRARAVTQMHGECIGRTVNRSIYHYAERCTAILDFCFICLRQSARSSLSSAIISWPARFFHPRFIPHRGSSLYETKEPAAPKCALYIHIIRLSLRFIDSMCRCSRRSDTFTRRKSLQLKMPGKKYGNR